MCWFRAIYRPVNEVARFIGLRLAKVKSKRYALFVLKQIRAAPGTVCVNG